MNQLKPGLYTIQTIFTTVVHRQPVRNVARFPGPPLMVPWLWCILLSPVHCWSAGPYLGGVWQTLFRDLLSTALPSWEPIPWRRKRAPTPQVNEVARPAPSAPPWLETGIWPSWPKTVLSRKTHKRDREATSQSPWTAGAMKCKPRSAGASVWNEADEQRRVAKRNEKGGFLRWILGSDISDSCSWNSF